MSAYRKLGERPEDGPDPLPQGPADKCIACDVPRHVRNSYNEIMRTNLEYPLACSPHKRVNELPYSFSFNPFAGRCNVMGEHLHERCLVCKHQWLTTFAAHGGAT